MTQYVCLALTLILELCLSARQEADYGVDYFVTRPDIVAPQWDVKIYDEDALAPGYWFMTPYETIGEKNPGGAWVGPHIYDQYGMLIWSGSYLFNDINIMDFKLSTVKGEKRLTMMYPVEGLGYIFDNHYDLVEKVPVGETGKTLNMHEFHYIDDGKTLLLLKRNSTFATKEMSAKTGYNGECHVTIEGFEEVDAETLETRFAWNTWDHVGLDEGSMDGGPPEGRCEGAAWDYIHTNALDKFTDGHYLLSGRHTDTIYKIDKDDGHIIWRAGGRKSDFDMGAANFSRQHHARFIEQNGAQTVISVFDNAKGADRQPPSSAFSRGMVIALNTDTMTAEVLKHYDHPHGRYAFRRGNFQILPNKNAFLCWSEQSLQTEHTEDGKTIMEARMLQQYVGTYRGFKYEFVGLPSRPPDVSPMVMGHGHVENSTNTKLWVSWNGATEVRTWNVYKTTKNGIPEVHVASAKKDGFETAIEFDGYAAFVVVEGLNKDGKSLGRSEVTETILSTDMSSEDPDVKNEMLWLKHAEVIIEDPSFADKAGMAFFDHPILTLLGLLGGLVFSPIVFGIIWYVRRRKQNAAWHRDELGPAYAPVLGTDAAEYDETKLDDLDHDGLHQLSEDEGP